MLKVNREGANKRERSLDLSMDRHELLGHVPTRLDRDADPDRDSFAVHHYLHFVSMESREDIPRVSVGSVNDWHKVRVNYRDAGLSLLKERTKASRTLSQEQDIIMAHLDQVSTPLFQRCLGF